MPDQETPAVPDPLEELVRALNGEEQVRTLRETFYNRELHEVDFPKPTISSTREDSD